METNQNPAAQGGIIYNVTIKVDKNISEEWLEWMLEEHVPDVMQTGCFHHYKVARLLDVDDSEGPTYAIQYHAASKERYDRYIHNFSKELQQRSFAKWGSRFIAFRSVLQVIR
jgi:hypothetical protein